jgi:ABC-2 type transport system permease protein
MTGQARAARGQDARGRRRKRVPTRPDQEPRQPAQHTAAVEVPRELRGGWRVIAAKEFADQVLSLRFLILTVVLAMAAAAAVYATAGAIKSVATQASGTPSLFLKVFTLSDGNIPAFTSFIAFLGPLLGIAFGFDAVNGERSEGTLPRLLAQPVHRDDVINGKFVAGLAAISLIFIAIAAIVGAIAIIQLGILPHTEEVLRLIVWIIVAVVYVGFWLALALLCSVLIRRAATSALVAIAAWLLVTVFWALLVGLAANLIAPIPADAISGGPEELHNTAVTYQLQRLSPTELFQESTAAVLDPSVRTLSPGLITAAQASGAVGSILSFDQSLLVISGQFVALIAATTVIFAVGYVAFMRQEVRA